MYIPKSFHVTERRVLNDFMRHNSFATLLSTRQGEPCVTHLPVLFDPSQGAHGTLFGHVARTNSHWRLFDGQQQALAIFHGPHAYISPQWYAAPPAVPTWNYAVLHVYGAPQVIEDDASRNHLMDRLIAFYEAGLPEPWSGELPEAFKAKMMQAIVAFRMPIERLEGKFKLGQNRSAEDQQRVIRYLRSSADPAALALADFTLKQLEQNAKPTPS